MRTQCPECSTLFNITQQHLDTANGQVRCAQCQTVFDGHANMQHEELPEPPQLDDIAYKEDSSSTEIDIVPENDVSTSSTLNTLIYNDLLNEGEHSHPRLGALLSKLFFFLCCLVLLCGLLLQVAYFKRAELVENRKLAPYVVQACNAVTFCSIPVKRALDQFQLESRHVYAHPNVDNALVVTASFRNKAAFPQPYPVIMLSMSNVRGQEVASRRFQPSEYLDSYTDTQTGMAAQQSTSLSLKLSDPGNQAMAFEIDFQ